MLHHHRDVTRLLHAAQILTRLHARYLALIREVPRTQTAHERRVIESVSEFADFIVLLVWGGRRSDMHEIGCLRNCREN